MLDDEVLRKVVEIYKNLLDETEYNLRIVNPRPDTRQCSSQLRVSYFDSIRNDLPLLPIALSDELRAVYNDLKEENIYIQELEKLGYIGFRNKNWSDSLRWGDLCMGLMAKLQKLRQEIKQRLEQAELVLRSGR